MAATGLKPTESNRGYPKSKWHNRPPYANHDNVWYDPATQAYVLTDEPYAWGETQFHPEGRDAWAATHKFQLVKARWQGMHFPSQRGTCLFLAAPNDSRLDLIKLVKRLDAFQPALIHPDD